MRQLRSRPGPVVPGCGRANPDPHLLPWLRCVGSQPPPSAAILWLGAWNFGAQVISTSVLKRAGEIEQLLDRGGAVSEVALLDGR